MACLQGVAPRACLGKVGHAGGLAQHAAAGGQRPRAGNQVQQRGLPGAVAPDNADALPRRKVVAEVAHDGAAARLGARALQHQHLVALRDG